MNQTFADIFRYPRWSVKCKRLLEESALIYLFIFFHCLHLNNVEGTCNSKGSDFHTDVANSCRACQPHAVHRKLCYSFEWNMPLVCPLITLSTKNITKKNTLCPKGDYNLNLMSCYKKAFNAVSIFCASHLQRQRCILRMETSQRWAKNLNLLLFSDVTCFFCLNFFFFFKGGRTLINFQ